MMKINKNIVSYSIGLNNDDIDVDIFCGESNVGVIIVPPDPNWGGDKNHPIVDSLFWSFVEKNISTMRFSFTRYPIINNNYVRYIAQTSVCLEEFINTAKIPEKFIILGYSFGAIIALNVLLRRPELQAGILIAPPIMVYHTFSWLSNYKRNVCLLYGEEDQLTPAHLHEEYEMLLTNNKMDVSMIKIPHSDHYFTGKINNLITMVHKYITGLNCKE